MKTYGYREGKLRNQRLKYEVQSGFKRRHEDIAIEFLYIIHSSTQKLIVVIPDVWIEQGLTLRKVLSRI